MSSAQLSKHLESLVTEDLCPAHSLSQVCRLVPWAISNYRLEDLTTVSELRKNVSKLFRKYETLKDPKVGLRSF